MADRPQSWPLEKYGDGDRQAGGVLIADRGPTAAFDWASDEAERHFQVRHLVSV